LARRRAGTPDPPRLACDLTNLGRNLSNHAKWSEAEALLREGLAIHDKADPDDHSRFDAMSLLGGALLGQRKYAEVEPLLVADHEGMKGREAKIPARFKFRLSKAAARVVQLYEVWGKPEQAGEWKRKLGLADLPADVVAPVQGR